MGNSWFVIFSIDENEIHLNNPIYVLQRELWKHTLLDFVIFAEAIGKVSRYTIPDPWVLELHVLYENATHAIIGRIKI